MRVLFVEPAQFFAEESMNKIVKQTPHIGLAYVATATKLAGHEVKVLDVPALRIGKQDYVQTLHEFNPEAVGFTAMTHNIMDVYEYAFLTKSFNPCIATFVGGPHVNAVPEQTLRECKQLDVAVKGEGEVTFPKLLARKGWNVGVVEGEQTKNLDDLPFPDWRLYDYEETYAKAYSYRFREMRQIYPVQTMRGCPYDCVFCFSHGLGREVRFRSARSIFEEIKRDVAEYGASFFYFADSNSTLFRQQMKELCGLILSEGLDVAWKCETHVHHVDKDLLTRMKLAGCELIFFGIESGNREVQKGIRKNLDLERVKYTVLDAKDVGLRVRGGFILGLPYETKQTVRDTLEFARSLKLEKAIFSILDVLPSTQVEAMVGNEGGMRYVNGCKPRWDEIQRSQVCVEVNDLSKEDLLRMFDKSYHIPTLELNDRMHKFCSELAYNFKEHPEVLKRYIRDNLGLIETFAKQK